MALKLPRERLGPAQQRGVQGGGAPLKYPVRLKNTSKEFSM